MNSANGAITVSSSGTAGTFILILQGSLSNNQNIGVIYTATGTAGTNTAPTFSSNPVAQTVNWKNSIPYQLPTYSDAEGNTVTLTTV